MIAAYDFHWSLEIAYKPPLISSSPLADPAVVELDRFTIFSMDCVQIFVVVA